MAFRNNQMAAGPPSLHLHSTIYKMFALKRPLESPALEPTPNFKKPLGGSADYIYEFEATTGDVEMKTEKTMLSTIEKIAKKEEDEKLRLAELARQTKKYQYETHPKIMAREEPGKITQNARNTIFIGRLSYDTTEETLKTFFGKHGTVKKLVLVRDLEGKSRGYAFLEMETERDAQTVYRETNKQEIDGRKILVDFERARTSRNWLPRRLGGGLGGVARKPKRKKRGGRREAPHRRP